jgi:hypothetical protein
MMRQLTETLLPSCGVAESVVTGQVIRVTCTQVLVDKPTPAEGELVTATATLFRRGEVGEAAAFVPLVGETLRYRVMKGTNILAQGQATTDANGQITFSFVVNDFGVFRFLASFFGKNPELPDTPERWIGCTQGTCLGVGGPGPGPGGVGDIGDIGIGGGGIIIGQPLNQPALSQQICGIGCGQNKQNVDGPEQGINWNLQGLEPE